MEQGTPFGRYHLIELLGRGGMGEVWRASDTAANNRTVAIKVLPAHLASDSSFVQRFRREADAAAQLNNPHIIPIHNYGEIEGRLYVDMRLVEGRDLQQVLDDGPLDPARAVRIVEQVARALQAAHKIGLIHRDVKPSNILVDEDDFAYLIDFGIARAADQTGLTSVGEVIGSFHYMAPERLRAHDADARADIYALACVLYECLTGSRPFPGESVESQMAAHLTNPPPQPSTRHDVPPLLDAVIAKGMAKDPDLRYPTTIELATAARDAITAPTQRPAPTVAVAAEAPRAATYAATAPRLPDPIPPPPPQPWYPGPGATPVQPRRGTPIGLILGVVALVAVLVLVAGIYLVVNYWKSWLTPQLSMPTVSVPSFQIPTVMPPLGPTSAGPGRPGVASGSKVLIDGVDQNVSGTAVCTTMSGTVNVAIGGASTGVGVVLTDADPPQVQSVGLGNVNGVTLGYSQGGGQGSASATRSGGTYQVVGTATGIDMANPMQPVNKSFEIDFSCS